MGGGARGAAWFYSTSYDVTDPRKWTTPREIAGSWSQFDTAGGCGSYKGWYPTLMSLNRKPGHLSTTNAYAFYLWGCQTGDTPPPGRQYSSRVLTMTLSNPGRHRAASH